MYQITDLEKEKKKHHHWTCSSGEPNERHCTSKGIAPALIAASTGGNSDFDSKRLISRRAPTSFCIAPFPLKVQA
jgi:hypothetical protein